MTDKNPSEALADYLYSQSYVKDAHGPDSGNVSASVVFSEVILDTDTSRLDIKPVPPHLRLLFRSIKKEVSTDD